MKSLRYALFAGLVSLTATVAAAKDVAVSPDVIEDIKAWASTAEIVAAVKAQNAENAKLSQADIDKLDKAWRAETKSDHQPMIKAILSKPVSGFLKAKKESSAGNYSEIFVMDNKGLNVGQSDVTSDYWQGDESKWKKSYGAGAQAVFVDDVEFDESSQTYQSQVSVSIVDPATNQVIGAVTVGVNVEG